MRNAQFPSMCLCLDYAGNKVIVLAILGKGLNVRSLMLYFNSCAKIKSYGHVSEMVETCVSNKSVATANTLVRSHLSARRFKLEHQFMSLLPVLEWPQELYEILVFKQSWSGMALTNKEHVFQSKVYDNIVWDWSRMVQKLNISDIKLLITPIR